MPFPVFIGYRTGYAINRDCMARGIWLFYIRLKRRMKGHPPIEFWWGWAPFKVKYEEEAC